MSERPLPGGSFELSPCVFSDNALPVIDWGLVISCSDQPSRFSKRAGHELSFGALAEILRVLGTVKSLFVVRSALHCLLWSLSIFVLAIERYFHTAASHDRYIPLICRIWPRSPCSASLGLCEQQRPAVDWVSIGVSCVVYMYWQNYWNVAGLNNYRGGSTLDNVKGGRSPNVIGDFANSLKIAD